MIWFEFAFNWNIWRWSQFTICIKIKHNLSIRHIYKSQEIPVGHNVDSSREEDLGKAFSVLWDLAIHSDRKQFSCQPQKQFPPSKMFYRKSGSRPHAPSLFFSFMNTIHKINLAVFHSIEIPYLSNPIGCLLFWL
jgi:hypothetical protein